MTPSPRPLEGLRVLDVATIFAGPITATFLAEFGAEVIKVELPGKGDTLREGATLAPGLSLIWLQEGRNKKSITLDLHQPEGQALLKRLVAVSDVMIENFRPGTLEQWNLAPEILLDINPGLVLVRISGYGQTGPYRRKGAFDRMAMAFGGGMYATGFPDAPPVRAGFAYADYMSGYVAAFSAVTALYWRDQRAGHGQVIDLAIYEPVLRASENSIPAFDREGVIRERAGNRNPTIVPSSSFPTADDQWVIIGANTERLWQRLATAIGRAEMLDDERYATLAARIANPEGVYAAIESWTLSKTAAEIIAIMDQAQVPAERINSVADMFAHPHIQSRENIVRVPDERVGTLAVPGVIPKFSATPGRIEYLGPDLGSHNDAIYGELLGLDASEIARLKERGVI